MKCSVCNKKVKSVFTIKCKCDRVLCLTHRYPDKHDCEFNFVQDNKQKLNKELIKVEHKKIEMI